MSDREAPTPPYLLVPGHGFWSAEGVSDLLAEVERLRAALERVYQTGRGPHVRIASEALDGE